MIHSLSCLSKSRDYFFENYQKYKKDFSLVILAIVSPCAHHITTFFRNDFSNGEKFFQNHLVYTEKRF